MQLFSFLSPIVFIVITTILGFVTPGYNHINHTISRLAIEKYGWIQTLNFLQLAFGLTCSGIYIAQTMQHEESRRIIKTVFTFTASILILAAFTPTDPIENVRFSFSRLSPTGMMHVGTIIVFLFISPLGISRLTRALASEPAFRHLARLTGYIGYASFIAGIGWFLFYLAGILLEYRGISQKAIALMVVFWILAIQMQAKKLNRTLHGSRK